MKNIILSIYKYKIKYNEDNYCLQFCGEAFYEHLADHTCKPCDPSCKTCSDAASSNCLSCSVSFLKNA